MALFVGERVHIHMQQASANASVEQKQVLQLQN